MKVKLNEVTYHVSVEFIFFSSDYNRTTIKISVFNLQLSITLTAKLQTFH